MNREHPGHAELDNGIFDEDYDVIVVGYGFAGGIAAIEAARNGAKVLICEKMPQPGGISICSGGAVRCARDANDAFSYLQATNAGTTPDDVLKVLAEGMVSAEILCEVADRVGAGRDLEADGGQERRQLPVSGMADVLFRSSAGDSRG